MIELQKALRRIIERYIAQMLPLSQDAVAGTNYAYVSSVRRFNINDEVVIRNPTLNSRGEFVNPDAELLIVTGIDTNDKLLRFDRDLQRSWSVSSGTIIQKLVGFVL